MEEEKSKDQESIRTGTNKLPSRIEISISGKRKEIHISKDIVRLLGAPPFLCMKVTKAMDSIAIMPCPGKEFMSFKVPDGILSNRNKSMKVVSSQFVDRLMRVNVLDESCTYQVMGRYIQKNNAVVFNMKDIHLV